MNKTEIHIITNSTIRNQPKHNKYPYTDTRTRTQTSQAHGKQTLKYNNENNNSCKQHIKCH